MKKTLEKILQYNNQSLLWLDKKPGNKHTKAGYLIEKYKKKTSKYVKPVIELNEKMEIEINDARAENALTDPETKKFIYDIIKNKDGDEVQMYAYTNEGRKARDKKIREITKSYDKQMEQLLEKEIEIEQYNTTDEIPESMSQIEIDAMRGFIFEEEKDAPQE